MKNRKFQIVLFFIISTLFFVSISSYSSYITPMAEGINISPATIGVILSATGFASMFTRFPIGILAQMFKKRKMVIQIGLLITVIAWTWAYLAPSVASLFIAKAVGGLTGATWVMYTVLFSTFFTEEEIPGSIGVINLASSIGPIIGASLGGYVASMFDFTESILVAVVAAIIAIVLTFLLEEPQKSPACSGKEALIIAKDQLKDVNAWKIALLATIPMMATYAFMDYLTPVILGDLGGGAIEIAITANCFRVSCIVASPLTGLFFYKKLGVKPTVTIGALGLALSCILMPFSTAFMMVYILHFTLGFFFTMNFAMLLALIIMGVPKNAQTTRMGLLQSVYSIGLAFGPLLSGIITGAFSTTVSSFIMGGAVLLIAILALVLTPKGLDQKDLHEKKLVEEK